GDPLLRWKSLPERRANLGSEHFTLSLAIPSKSTSTLIVRAAQVNGCPFTETKVPEDVEYTTLFWNTTEDGQVTSCLTPESYRMLFLITFPVKDPEESSQRLPSRLFTKGLL